jgi:hypothetical protein
MPKIGPARTVKELKDSANHTCGCHGRWGLPGVTTDAKMVDRKAYAENRELALRINDELHALKRSDKRGPLFVLGWRMYPNAAHPYWQGKVHSCGCGCGCSSGRKPRGKAKKRKT